MSDSNTNITGFNIGGETRKVDYESLANKPTIPEDTNTTYELVQDADDPDKLILKGSDGSTKELEIKHPDISGLEKRVNQLEFNVTINHGGTITLEDDITDVTKSICVDAEVVIDLNGHTISGSIPEVFSIGSNGNLTIKDSVGTGKVKADFNTSWGGIAVNGGVFILESGTIEAGGASTGYGVYCNNGGTATIKGGTISSTSSALAGNNTTGDMNFYVYGGTLTAKQGPAIYMPGQVNMKITGGTLNGGISLRMGQVDVSGGEIKATTGSIDSPAKYYNYSGNAWFPDAIYVNAGTYTSKNEAYGNSLNLNITGGKITCANGQGSAVAIYDCGKVEQTAKVTITDGATLTTDATDRKAFNVLSLADIGVTSPAAGYGTYSGNIQTDIADGIVA